MAIDTQTQGDALAPPSFDFTPTPLGHAMRNWFLFPPTFRNFNQGAYGVTPAPVMAYRAHLLAQGEARPDEFMRVQMPARLWAARETYAAVLGSRPEDTAVVQNATMGVNVALRNVAWAPGDRILFFACAYGGCLNSVLSVCETTAAEAEAIALRLGGADGVSGPSFAEIVAAFEERVRVVRARGETPRMLLFDTLVSEPGLRFPYEALTRKCRELGVMSLVDGAHGVGCLDLDLPALDPDFFVSNGHKWLFVPRASAVFYAPERNHHLVRTAFPTSWGWRPLPTDEGEPSTETRNLLGPAPGEESTFALAFKHVGTIDWTPHLSVGLAVRFRDEVCGGEAAIRAYSNDLALRGGRRVAEILGTDVMDNAEGELTRDLPLVNIYLPLDLGQVKQDARGVLSVTSWMGQRCIHDFDTWIKVEVYAGRLYTRLSAQVYLDMSDFDFAGETLKGLCERVRAGEHLP